MPSIFIYGSCVSRDPFEKPSDFKLEGYFARSSLASAFSEPPAPGTPLPDVEALSSNFQKRMLETDIKKSLPALLKSTPFDVLVVDFIDERMSTLQLGESTITESEELKATGYPIPSSDVYEPWSETGLALRLQGIRALAGVVDPSKIIVNRVYWATVDTDGVPFPRSRWFDRNNRLLYDLYKEIEKIPGVRFIDYPGGAPMAAAKHKWGRQPYHYSELANDHFLAELKRLTGSEDELRAP
ncbi:DUF6270 domain-containing protein [Paenarthrobacter sp. NPDC089675]|uniref:DUF6270 domain-containing protein n=1 Tax=Paenarthrobacter sp. NPDC089675 TaxID=3364376 RepID=UPI0037F863E7